MDGLKWVKVNKYCQLSGDTLEAVRAKRRKQIWKDGVHYAKGQDGCFYINVMAVEQWVESNLNSQSLAA